MKNRFIDDFEIILLDMGNTFMFGADRFGDDEDYHGTYCRLGGNSLGPAHIRSFITKALEQMLHAYRDPLRYDDFGDIRRFLAEVDSFCEIPVTERELIVNVFSQHEVGTVPEYHVEALHQLAGSHTLGIVSNIWAPSRVFDELLERSGLDDLFTVRVWSSDHMSIKPSPLLFQKALNELEADVSKVLYVGDDPMRDIGGAKGLGMKAAWIKNGERPLTAEHQQPDLIISSLTQLPRALTGMQSGEKS